MNKEEESVKRTNPPENNYPQLPTKSEGMPMVVIQSLAWVLLTGMIVGDKFLGAFAQPLDDLYYAAAFAVAVGGIVAVKILDRIASKD